LREFAYAPRSAWLAAGAEAVDVAEEFHEASKIAAAFPARSLGPAGALLTASPDAPFSLGRKALAFCGPRIGLPAARSLAVDLRDAIRTRHSALPATGAPIGLDDLGTVLALSAGSSPQRPGLRVTPSAGAMYPLDIVVIAHAVDGLDPGAYLYEPLGHTLLPRGEVDPETFHSRADAGASPPLPSATLAVVATFARSRAKYGLRGYRFCLIEAGHLVQAVLTVATALGLATLPWGGFVDSAVDAELDLDGVDRSCLYLAALSGLRAPGGAS
jgi:SagB-type dehydrogenase family enzyme